MRLNMFYRRALLTSIIALLMAISFPIIASAERQPLANQTQVEKINSANQSKGGLRRLDFFVQGKSCAVCLMGIQKRIKALNGTIKVAIMLKKPYGASVIYDSKKLGKEKLIEAIKRNEPKVSLLDVQDQAVEQSPFILIPPHNR